MSQISKFRRVVLTLIIVIALLTLGGGIVSLTGCDTTSGGECTHEHTTTTCTATCTAGGVETVTCDDCHLVISEKQVNALGHDYVEDTTQAIEATCSSEGKVVYVCSRCGDTQEASTDKKVHTYDNGVVTEPTCTTQGYTTYTCTECGYSYKTDYTAAGAHTYDSGVVTEPTCLTQGYTTYTCTTCNERYVSDYVAATGHVWDNDAACVDKECTVCGATEHASVSHSYELTSDTATCENEGTATYTCTACSHYYTETSLAKGHTFAVDSSGQIKWTDTDKDPVLKENTTCTYTCVHSAYCTTCHQDVEQEYETDIHNYVLTVTSQATCSTAGTKEMLCTGCLTKQEGTTAVSYYIDHTYVEGSTDADGCTTYTCSVCSNTKVTYTGKTATVTTDALKNDIELGSGGAVISMSEAALKGLTDSVSSDTTLSLSADAADASDASSGLSSSDQTRVGSNQIYSITLTNGATYITNFDGKITVKIPYDLPDGEDETYITIFYISDTGLVTIDAVYEAGYVTFETDHFSYYSVGKYTAEELCNRYGHNIKVLDKDATCTEAGYHIEICTRCNKTLVNETKAALGHNFEETITKAATCTENGTVTYTCSHCNQSYSGVIAATGHTWILDNTSVAATCEHAGRNDYHCSDCDATYSADLLQLAHTYVAVTTDPTCEEQGYTTYTCSMCGHSYVADYVAATGHSWNTDAACAEKECLICHATMHATAEHNYENGVCTVCGSGCDHSYITEVVAPTCTEYGYTIKYCVKCGSSTVSDYVNPIGHTYTIDINKCDVCGSTNPDIVNILNSIVESCYSYDCTLMLTDVSFVVTEDDTYYDEHYSYTYEVDEATLYLTIQNNAIIIYGNGAVYFERGGTSTYSYTSSVDIYGDGEYIYLYVKVEGSEQDELLTRVSYEYALGDYYDYIDMVLNPEDTISMYMEMIEDSAKEALGAELYQNWVTILSSNSSLANELAATIFTELFSGSATESGYEFTFNMDLLGTLNSDLYSLTVSQLLDKYVGEGALTSLKTYITNIENKTLNNLVTEILVYGEDYGITKEIAFTTIDTLILFATGNEFSIEDWLTEGTEEAQAYGEMTISEILKNYAGLEDYSLINETIDEYSDIKIYDQLTGKAEYSEILYNAIAKIASDEVVSIKFTTDKNFSVTSVQLVLDDAVYTQTSYYAEDADSEDESSDELKTTYTSTNTITLSGTLSLLYSCELPEGYESYKTEIEGIYSTVVTSLKKACEDSSTNTIALDSWHTLGINKDGTVYLIYEYNTGIIDLEEFEKALGSAVMEELTALYEAGECEEYEAEYGSELYWEIYNELWDEVYDEYCEKYSVTVTDITTANNIQIEYDCTNCYYVYFYFVTAEDEYVSVSFYINVKDNVVTAYTFHNYVEIEAPEGVPTSADEVDCGECYYTYYKCTICGQVISESYYKWHSTSAKYTLITEGSSCEDGVLVEYICKYCNRVTSSYTTYGHILYDEVAFTLTCNSDTYNGTRTYYRQCCPCGEHCSYLSDNDYGCWFNERSKVEYILEDGTVVGEDEVPEGKMVIGQIDTFNCYYTGCQNYYTHKWYYCGKYGDDIFTYYQYNEDGTYTTVYTYSEEYSEHHYYLYASDYSTENGIVVDWHGYYCKYCNSGYRYIYKYYEAGNAVCDAYEETDSSGNVTYAWYITYSYDEDGNLLYESCEETDSKGNSTITWYVTYSYDEDGSTTMYRYEYGEFVYSYKYAESYDETTGNITSSYTYTYANGRVITETYTGDKYDRCIYYYYCRTSSNGNVTWSWYKYEFSAEDLCYATYTYANSDGEEGSEEGYYHNTSSYYFNNNNGTCTQPYTCGWCCNLCNKVTSSTEVVNCHSWYLNEDGIYVCSRCGLESANGSSSNIYLEEFTGNDIYGKTGYVSVGYYAADSDRQDIGIYFYFVAKDGTGSDIEITLSYEDTGSIIHILLADIQAMAASKGISLDNYDLKISFYDVTSYEVSSITLTDLATSTSSGSEGSEGSESSESSGT